jgi:hypothetical protein
MMTCPVCGQEARFVATNMRGQEILGRTYYHDQEMHHVGEPIIPPIVASER